MTDDSVGAVSLAIKTHGQISAIGQAAWDACANPVEANPECGVPFDPFTSYAFLSALEESESACARTGWAPYHLELVSEDEGTKPSKF